MYSTNRSAPPDPNKETRSSQSSSSSSNSNNNNNNNNIILNHQQEATATATATAAPVASLLDDEVLQQYRLMAQVEANIRIRDNTGFDKEEYQRQQLERDAEQQNQRPRHIRYFFPASTRPRPMLPEPRIAAAVVSSTNNNNNGIRSSSTSSNSELLLSSSSSHHSTSINNNGLLTSSLTSSTSSVVRAEEPPLPPRRANRRFVEHPRTPTVPELCEGIVIRWSDGRHRIITEEEEEKVQEESDLYIIQHTNPTSILSDSEESSGFNRSNILLDPKHTVVVDCLGCHCWLRVHRLASLVKCQECLSVTPSIPIDEEEQQHDNKGGSGEGGDE